MRLGLQVPNFTWRSGPAALGETFATVVDRAEAAGLDSLWVMDHFFQIRSVGPAENDMLEGWSALAFAAGRTRRIRLGTMVTGVTYRHPGLLVKTATTLDVLSGGRSYFGVGAAWNEQEHRGLGVPFPPLGERFERLEETLRIALQMWAGDESAFEGRHYHLERPLNSPQPVQRPHPPILIGGGGERKTLRLVAQYADACNLFAYDHDVVRAKLEVLRRHCDDLGRDYADIEKTSLGAIRLTRADAQDAVTPEAYVDTLRTLAGMGIDHAIFSLRNVDEEEPFRLLEEVVVPAARELTPAGR